MEKSKVVGVEKIISMQSASCVNNATALVFLKELTPEFGPAGPSYSVDVICSYQTGEDSSCRASGKKCWIYKQFQELPIDKS